MSSFKENKEKLNEYIVNLTEEQKEKDFQELEEWYGIGPSCDDYLKAGWNSDGLIK